MSLRLDWCSYAAARYATRHWHYACAAPNGKTVRLGVWEDGLFIGCVLFGDGANNNQLAPFGLRYGEGCALLRVALARHQAPVSRIVRVALRMLKTAYPSMRLIVSYADPEHGHHGGIYQAGNWIDTGQTGQAEEYRVRGVRMHGKALRQTRRTHAWRAIPARNTLDWARKVLDPRASAMAGSRKHRYVFPLDDEMRRFIEPLAQPYPKRPTGVESDTAAHQAAERGARPTVGLHNDHDYARVITG